MQFSEANRLSSREMVSSSNARWTYHLLVAIAFEITTRGASFACGLKFQIKWHYVIS